MAAVHGRRIYAGEPIIEPKLLARGQVPTDGMVPKGLRVVPVPVGLEADPQRTRAPRIALRRASFHSQDAPTMGVARNPLQDHPAGHPRICRQRRHEHRVARIPNLPDTTSIPTGKTVSLLVTPAQAQIVTLASQLGSIRLILRSGDDNDQPKTAVMTSRDLLGAGGGSDRAEEDPNAANEKRFQEWAEMIKKTMRENAKTAPHGPTARRCSSDLRCGSERGAGRSTTSF